MDRLLPEDELSVIRQEINADFAMTPEERKKRKEDRIDEILELLILSYMYGNEAANDMLFGSDFVESLGFDPEDFGMNGDGTERTIPINVESMNESVYTKVADKDWVQRVEEYYDSDSGTADDVYRVVDTDTHRVYNDAISNVGEQVENSGTHVMKTWVTMEDDRVRDAHFRLSGVTIPFRDRFYVDGDSARYPGDFTSADLNCNCRCRLLLETRR